MNCTRNTKLTTSLSALSGLLCLTLATNANAGDLSVAGNSVTVLNGVTSLGTETIAANGLVSDVTGVPTSAGGLNFPNFTFTFEKNAGFVDGSYTFRGGFIIDQDSSGRRLELSIPSITMTISGGTLSGSVSAAQSVSVIGRNDDSSIQAVTTISNNLAAFSGGTLSFNSSNQLNKIIAGGGILADIINSLNATAHYHYSVFLKQTSGPDNVRFGRDATGTLTPFPCNDGSAFILNSGALASAYNGAYALQGRVSFAGAGGGQEAAPTPYSSTCATFTPSTGGGGGATSTESSISDASDGLNAATTPAQISAAVDTANTLAASVASQISSGTATIANGVALLETLNTGLGVIGTSTAAGTAIDQSKVTDTLNSISTLVGAVGAQTLSSAQLASVQSTVVTTMSNLINTVPANADSTQTRALLTQVSNVLKQVSGLPGSSLTAELADGARAVSLTVAQSLNIASNPRKPNSAAKRAIDNVLRKTAKLIKLDFRPQLGAPGSNSITALQSAQSRVSAIQTAPGTAAAMADSVTQAQVAFDPDLVVIGTSTGPLSAKDNLLNAFAVDGATATFDGTNNTLRLAAGGLEASTYVTDAFLIPDIFPYGVFDNPDGSLTAYSAAMGVTAVPAPRYPAEFFGALESATISTSVSEEGIITLTAASGETLSGSFGFDIAPPGTSGIGTATFGALSGDPADPGYVISVVYSDGSTQSFQPMLNFPVLLESVSELGVDLGVDRSTGLITSDDGLSLRADYFVKSNSPDDAGYWDANKDELGIALRQSTDFNGDGTLDVEVFTSSSNQVLYLRP